MRSYILNFVLPAILVLTLGCNRAEFGIGGSNANNGNGPSSNKPSTSDKLGANKKVIRHNYKPQEITQLCQQGLDVAKAELAQDNLNVLKIDQTLANLNDALSPLTFMGYVHSSEAIRAEASQCEEKLSQFYVEVFTRRDLYQAVVQSKTSGPRQARLLKEMRRSFEQNGMALSDEKLGEFRKLKSELASLETQFSKNLNEDTTAAVFEESELTGVSEDFKASLKKNKDGHYIISTKITGFLQVMENASSPTARKKMLMAYDGRSGKENTALLEKAVQLRQQIASLMGYKTWADYRIDGRMAQNATNPTQKLTSLKERLRPRLEADMELLLKAKKSMEDSSAKELKAWDLRYFANQVKKSEYSLDDEVIREYFPKDLVVDGMFSVYSKLFDVSFVPVTGADVWDKTTKLYAIVDGVGEITSNKIIAYFYADLHPRDGKYGHAAAFPLISGRVLTTSEYSVPVASIVANFTAPTASKPSLLTHDEVETLFHEFGHIIHQVLTRVEYASLSGTSVAQDYVEAPSQMLENWVWDADILKRISRHYKTGASLPDDLIQKMVRARDFNVGYHYSRQIVLGLTDLTMHTAVGAVDVNQVYREMHSSVLGIAPVEGSQWMAGFGHMMGGYDAGYYGYIWSEIFAADMFTVFAEGGLLNPESGKAYRRLILESGNSLDPLELIEGFLGRKSTEDAFLKKLGL